MVDLRQWISFGLPIIREVKRKASRKAHVGYMVHVFPYRKRCYATNLIFFYRIISLYNLQEIYVYTITYLEFITDEHTDMAF